MFKVKETKDSGIIKMGDMEPLQIGVIQDGYRAGHTVMRTSSRSTFEVMALTKTGADNCWTNKETSIKVKLLQPGETVTLEVI